MPKFAKGEEWQCYAPGKEDLSKCCRYPSKGISYTSDNEILEKRGLSYEWRLVFGASKVALGDQLVGHSEY